MRRDYNHLNMESIDLESVTIELFVTKTKMERLSSSHYSDIEERFINRCLIGHKDTTLETLLLYGPYKRYRLTHYHLLIPQSHHMTHRFCCSYRSMTCTQSHMTIAYTSNDKISIFTRFDYYLRSISSDEYDDRLFSPYMVN